jgi:hypothetical protein
MKTDACRIEQAKFRAKWAAHPRMILSAICCGLSDRIDFLAAMKRAGTGSRERHLLEFFLPIFAAQVPFDTYDSPMKTECSRY